MPDPAPAADRWDRIASLFEAASALPEAERAAFLHEAGADDALAAEVLDLIGHAASAEDAWGESASVFAEPLLDEGELRRGTQVGPYALDRPLGRGGMGTVWLAHRTDDLRLRVALKVVRRGLDTADVRERFRQEHRVLGALDHPGIARLLDGGVTPDGLPFFAMELVEGEPITAYADRRQLGVEARLALFAQVCDAVQYAHRHLVVHRDLKPSNVLVASGDGTGDRGTRDSGASPPSPQPRVPSPRVKLLDFGIAKVLDPDDLGLSRLFTRAEQRLLTPAYAAPEQLRGEPVTTAADVYALGVLLYELLTGRPPVTARRRLEAVEPVRPSEAVRETVTVAQADGTTTTLTPAAVGEARRLAPERLRKTLAGDLDTIVLMALRPEPGRRYESAAGLADDVARHLAGQTVRARPDTVGYRARTFVKRHRVGVGVAVLLVGLLTAFAATMTVERGRTAREAEKARAVADVLGGLFAATNPMVADGDTLTVVEFLEASEGRLRAELAGQPDVLAEVLGVVGGAYRDMTQFARADSALRDALALRRRLDPDGQTTADALGELATLQFMANDLDDALATATERLDVLRRLYGPRDPRVVPAYERIAAVHLQAHRLDAARATLDAALAITRPRQAADPEAHLGVVGLEGWYFAEAGDPAASVRVAREVLALHRRTGAALADVALAERILGNQCYAMGDFACSERALRAALRDYRRVFGDDNRYVALVLGHLAETAASDGRLARADSLFPAALAMKTRYFGPDAPEVGYTLLRYGRHLHERGRLAEADRLLERAEAVWPARPPDDPQRLTAHAARALVRVDLGDLAWADSLEAVWVRVEASPPGPTRASVQLAVAGLRRRQGRVAEAEALRREAAPVLRTTALRRYAEGPLLLLTLR